MAMNSEEPAHLDALAQRIERTTMHAYARFAETLSARQFWDYESLWRWSIEEPEQFWDSIWDFCGVWVSAARAPW